ncbi:MAG: hypothetical protein WCR06_04805 [bacterium]
MDSDLIALREEIDTRLEEVEASRGTCNGHHALSRAIGTLLRCQRAQLNQRAATVNAAAKCGGIVGALLVGAVEAAKYLFGGGR